MSSAATPSPRWVGSKRRLRWALVQTKWPQEKIGLYLTMPLCVEDARRVADAAGVPLAAMLQSDPSRWEMLKAHLRGLRRAES